MSHQSQQVAHTVNHSVPSTLTGNSCKTEDLIKLERLEWDIPADTSDNIVQELKKLDGSLDLFSINMIKNELRDHYRPEITLAFLTGLQGIRRELLKTSKEHPQGDTRQTIQAVTEREYKFGQRNFYLYRCPWCGAVKRIQRRPGQPLSYLQHGQEKIGHNECNCRDPCWKPTDVIVLRKSLTILGTLYGEIEWQLCYICEIVSGAE